MGTARAHPFLRRGALSAAFLIFLCVVAAQQSSPPKYVPISLPGANGLVMLDYFAYDPASARLWVPAGNLGRVDVIDTNTDQVSEVGGFPTGQVEFRGKLRTMGPSSVTVGDGVVYIGSRADSRICVIDAHKPEARRLCSVCSRICGIGLGSRRPDLHRGYPRIVVH